jgi:DNA-binding NtrC family response regulator
VAPTTISVLILGECGVGKDVLARMIHERSQRADKPFLKNGMECAAALSEGTEIGFDDLPNCDWQADATAPPAVAIDRAPASPSPVFDVRDADERRRVLAAPAVCNGNQTRAAAFLRMSRRTFVTKLDQYQVPRPQKDYRQRLEADPAGDEVVDTPASGAPWSAWARVIATHAPATVRAR